MVWFLTTTQRRLRERDPARRSRSCTFEREWFLGVTRTSVAQGHSAGPAASCRSGNPTSTSARYARVFRQEAGEGDVRCRVLCFTVYFCCVCLYFNQDEMENVSPTLKNTLNFISPSIQHPSSLHPFFSSSSPLPEVLWQPRIPPRAVFYNHAMVSFYHHHQ